MVHFIFTFPCLGAIYYLEISTYKSWIPTCGLIFMPSTYKILEHVFCSKCKQIMYLQNYINISISNLLNLINIKPIFSLSTYIKRSREHCSPTSTAPHPENNSRHCDLTDFWALLLLFLPCVFARSLSVVETWVSQRGFSSREEEQ